MRRSASGESNKHLFLNVEAVVYVEGGMSRSREEVSLGLFDKEAVDILFWRQIFEQFHPTTKLEFRAIGSKKTLLSIAEDIRDGKIKNVIVAMDRDFDNFRGQLISCQGVVYTCGYSWENDVCDARVVESVFYTLCPAAPGTFPVAEEIAALLGEFRRMARWPVYGDIMLNLIGRSLLPRPKPESILKASSAGRPTINTKKLIQLVQDERKVRSGPIKCSNPIKFDPINDCYGHLVAIYLFRVVLYLLRRFSKTANNSIPRRVVEALFVDKFFKLFGNGEMPHLHKCYKESVGNLSL